MNLLLADIYLAELQTAVWTELNKGNQPKTVLLALELANLLPKSGDLKDVFLA